MTDGNQDDTTQPLVEGHEANEKPVHSEIQPDHAAIDNNQLESGAPLNENQSNQEVLNTDEGESTKEDSLPQESAAKEDGEPVQATESVKPVEQVESEPADDRPNENEKSSCDNKTASEIQEGEQIECEEVGEQQQDADEQKDVPPDEKKQSVATPAGEAEVGDTTSTTHTEQQEHFSPVTSGQENQDSPVENTEQETPAPSQEQQDTPVENKEQEIVAFSQEQQDSPAENEKGNKPVDGSENQGMIEEQQAEEGQANGEVTKETLPNENSPNSDATTEKAQQLDEASQQGGNGLGNEAIKSEPTVEELNQTAPKVEVPVESPQAVQSEPTVTVQVVTVPADELQEENKKLKQDIFMMKQQEDAYRIKVLSLEQEVGKLRARKIDNRSQDSLASDSDSYLKQKLAETERELDTAERKVKDLQLRLKRFAKDDQIKDEKISQMEREVKELSDHTKKLEQSLADSKRENNNNATMQAGSDKNDSKVCVIL